MAINKVVYNNETLIDISGDTVTSDQLGYGITAHDSSGQRITGTVNMSGASNIPTKVSDLTNDLDFIQNGTTDDVTFSGNVAMPVDGFLKIVKAQKAYTCSANTTITISDFSVDLGNGWTRLCVTGFATGNGSMLCQAMNMSNDIPRIAIRNVSSSSISATASIFILCIRTSFT